MAVEFQHSDLTRLGLLNPNEKAKINAERRSVELRNKQEEAAIHNLTELPEKYSWMSEPYFHFILALFLNKGDDDAGMHKSEALRWEKQNKGLDMLFQLDARQYITWEKDQMGRDMYVVLTWQGEDLAKMLLAIARNQNRKQRESEAAGVVDVE